MSEKRAPDRDSFAWQGPVLDKDLLAPPGSPSEGDRYIVGSPSIGAWATHEDAIAEYVSSAWEFYAPADGWLTAVRDEGELYYYNGTAWSAYSPGTGVGLWDQDGTVFTNAAHIAEGETFEALGDPDDDASAIGLVLKAKRVLTTTGAILVAVYNAATRKFYLTEEGHPVLDVPTWEDMLVSTWAVELASGARAPDFIRFQNDGGGSPPAGSIGTFVWHFDKSLREDLFFATQIPHRWKPETDLRYHVHWTPVDTGTGVVRWGLEYSVAKVGGTFGNTTTIYAEQAGAGVAYGHQLAQFPVIDTTGLEESSVLSCRIFRDAPHANDTYDADAALLSSDFHYQVEKMGTKSYAPPWEK